MMLIALLATGCNAFVLEYPDTPDTRTVTLHVERKSEWDFDRIVSENTPSRAINSDLVMERFIVNIYARGKSEYCVSQQIFYKPLLTDHRTDLEVAVPPGDWDLRVWNDLVYQDTRESLFYNADNFAAITFKLPYQGSDLHKEAFVGKIQMNVPDTYNLEWTPEDSSITLERPLSAYVLVSTDLEKFVLAEIAKNANIVKTNTKSEITENTRVIMVNGEKIPLQNIDLTGYKIRVMYTGYLPSVFHHFTNRPIDSATGIYFDSDITILDTGEAMIAFDHILVNGIESAVNLAVDLYNDKGVRLVSVGTSTIPLKRGRCTVIRGKFLTASTNGSTVIQPEFDGDFNIHIK